MVSLALGSFIVIDRCSLLTGKERERERRTILWGEMGDILSLSLSLCVFLSFFLCVCVSVFSPFLCVFIPFLCMSPFFFVCVFFYLSLSPSRSLTRSLTHSLFSFSLSLLFLAIVFFSYYFCISTILISTQKHVTRLPLCVY